MNYKIITDLPPEIHYLICNHITSSIDKFNFALTSITIYNSVDTNKITHNMKMKSILDQINSIYYDCETSLTFVNNKISTRRLGKREAQYTLWKCREKHNMYKFRSFADILNCFTIRQNEFKNNCSRIPVIYKSQFDFKSSLYTLNTIRKCIIDWDINEGHYHIKTQIINNNSLKPKNYQKIFHRR